MIGILLTQRMMDSPEPPKVFTDFWTLAYGAMEWATGYRQRPEKRQTAFLSVACSP